MNVETALYMSDAVDLKLKKFEGISLVFVSRAT